MLNVRQFAAQASLHPSRIRLLLKQGRIQGAVKFGRVWIIPDSATILPPRAAVAIAAMPPIL